jgi:site-specific recombinase XerD
MSVRERGSSWQIDINLGKGGRHFHTLRKDKYDYNDALVLEVEIRKELGKVKHSKDDINSKVHDYLEWVRLHQSTVTHKKKKYILFGYILPSFGNLTPERITEGLITGYKNKRKQGITSKRSKGGNKSINDELLVLRHLCRKMFKYKLDAELLPYKAELPTVLTKGEVHRFLSALEPRYRLMFSLMYYAGLRKSEAVNLTWQSVQSDCLILKGKGSRWRSIPLSKELMKEIALLNGGVHDVNTFVFQSRTGKQIKHLDRIYERARQKAGIEKRVYCHLLRHSFGTHIVEGTGDMRTLQELLGHAKITTTQIYSQISSEHKRQVLEEGLYGNIHSNIVTSNDG